MGYTNYWSPKKLTKEQVPAQFWEDSEKVLDMIIDKGVKLATGDGEELLKSGKEIIEKSNNGEGQTYPAIYLNGYAKGEEDESYETFGLVFDGEWNFCKTAREPYDLAVKCILMLAEQYGLLEKMEVEEKVWDFDGDTDEEEYTNASEIITILNIQK